MFLKNSQEELDAYIGHVHVIKCIGVPLKPKHHAVVHLICRQYFMGAARCSAAWWDENLNRKAKEVAARCHGLTWYRRFLGRVEWVLGLSSTR